MVVRRLDLIPLPQADQPKGQQAAQLCAPLNWAHLVRRQRVRTFHAATRAADPRTERWMAARFHRKFR